MLFHDLLVCMQKFCSIFYLCWEMLVGMLVSGGDSRVIFRGILCNLALAADDCINSGLRQVQFVFCPSECVHVCPIFSTNTYCVCRADILIIRTRAASLHRILISVPMFTSRYPSYLKFKCTDMHVLTKLENYKWWFGPSMSRGFSVSAAINEWRPNYCPT